MKRLLLSALLIASPLICNAGISVNLNLGDPGFYGPVDIVGAPPPQLVYSTPRIVVRGRRSYSPLYLRVPVIYIQDWPRYCHYYSNYNACDRPVYFVQDSWYQGTYVNYYQRRHGYGGSYNNGGSGYGGNYGGNRAVINSANRNGYYSGNRPVINSTNRSGNFSGNQAVINSTNRGSNFSGNRPMTNSATPGRNLSGNNRAVINSANQGSGGNFAGGANHAGGAKHAGGDRHAGGAKHAGGDKHGGGDKHANGGKHG
jgi:hypothetical protein